MRTATHPSIDTLIAAAAPVAIGVSGGKDSQAAALAVIDHLDRAGHAGPRLLVHADLGLVEWRDSLPWCRSLADHLGLELVVLRRERGDLMERWERRWHSSVTRYRDLATVTLVPCWSTPALRFCTSEMKSHPIAAMLKRRFQGQTVINVTGVRWAESRRRARLPIADLDAGGRIWTWRPIIGWSEAEVFSSIARHGLDPHPAYRRFGMSRVSCRFCIMSSLPDLVAASRQDEAWETYRAIVSLETRSSFAFQGARWLGDIAPHLLEAAEREALFEAKDRARLRMEAERRITPEMLYVRGWPRRMLTDAEADILASVRQTINALFGFGAHHLGRSSIHHRYAQLLAQKTQRAERARP